MEDFGWVVLGLIPKRKKPGKRGGKKEPEQFFPEPSALSKEAFSFFRANLHFVNAERNKKAVSVTSVMPAEGKTFVTLHLAATCAAAGEKVLAVETDITNPKFLSYFGELKEKASKGSFVDILEGRLAEPNQTHIENLWVLPAGAQTGKADTVMFGERMLRYIEEWKKDFDWIFLDVPSLQIEAHSGIIFKSSDGVIPVVLANKSQKKAVLRLKNILETLKVEVFGAVLNGVSDFSIFGSYYGKKK
jgi:capsular exopolysaccharide synthesis family protein